MKYHFQRFFVIVNGRVFLVKAIVRVNDNLFVFTDFAVFIVPTRELIRNEEYILGEHDKIAIYIDTEHIHKTFSLYSINVISVEDVIEYSKKLPNGKYLFLEVSVPLPVPVNKQMVNVTIPELKLKNGIVNDFWKMK